MKILRLIVSSLLVSAAVLLGTFAQVMPAAPVHGGDPPHYSNSNPANIELGRYATMALKAAQPEAAHVRITEA